jgi:hypothetical protein
MRRFLDELRGRGFDVGALIGTSADALAHFGVAVACDEPVDADPASDYAEYVDAVQPEGRTLVLFPQAALLELVSHVRAAICAAVEGLECGA